MKYKINVLYTVMGIIHFHLCTVDETLISKRCVDTGLGTSLVHSNNKSILYLFFSFVLGFSHHLGFTFFLCAACFDMSSSSAPQLSCLSYTHLSTLGLVSLFFISLIFPHLALVPYIILFLPHHMPVP